jgi:hypothetical protein
MKKNLLLMVIAFLSITYQTFACTSWAVSPSDQQVPCGGGTNYAAGVTASGSCTYNCVPQESWITLASYSGGTFYYNVAANTSGYAQTGYIYVYDVTDGNVLVATLEIDQATCSTSCTNWVVSPSYQEVPCGGGTNYAGGVSASGSCTYNCVPQESWITISSFSGGTFYYDVAANSSGSAQTGYIYVYDVTDGNTWVATLEVYQDACVGCTNWATNPSDQQVPPQGGSYSTAVSATGSCSYNYTMGDPWITFVSYGSGGVLNYDVSVNNTGLARTGYIYINDVTDGYNDVTTLEVDQDACCTNWVVSPSYQQVSAHGGNYAIDVSASGTCTYNYTISDPSWISFASYGSGGILNYYVYPNTTGYPGSVRTGYIYINDVTCSINDVNTLTINQESSVGINEIGSDNTINIYPNPVTNNITIETPQQATIEITDIQGRLIKTLEVNAGKTSVDVSTLPSGVYIVKAKTEKGVTFKKIVKE